MAKNLPAMQETRVQSLGQGSSLEKEMATHSGILALRRSLVGYSPWGCKELDMTQWLNIQRPILEYQKKGGGAARIKKPTKTNSKQALLFREEFCVYFCL